jgi:TRAP-type uncharacterized transport system substrate-binding protein
LTNRPDVVIGTASPTEIYYPLGGSICRLFNLDTPRHGLRCDNTDVEPAPTERFDIRNGS